MPTRQLTTLPSLFHPSRWLVWVLRGPGRPRAVAGNQRAAWAAGAESHWHSACGGLHRSRPRPYVPGAPGVPQADPCGDAAHGALPGLRGGRGRPDHGSLAVYHCGNWLKGVRLWALCELQLHFEKLKRSTVSPPSGRPNAQPVYSQHGGGGGYHIHNFFVWNSRDIEALSEKFKDCTVLQMFCCVTFVRDTMCSASLFTTQGENFAFINFCFKLGWHWKWVEVIGTSAKVGSW